MNNKITAYEHENLTLKHPELSEKHLKALQLYFGRNGIPYYSLIHQGIKFNSFVGVIQVGNLTIEVLPKLEKRDTSDENSANTWRVFLLEMLHYVGDLKVYGSDNSSLKIKSNHLLHLYFEIFVYQVESLLHRGLIKKYRKTESNQKALNGAIQFPKQISRNLIHQERFYTKHTIYDDQHLLHFILYKAIKLLHSINQIKSLDSRIQNLILNFPEMPDTPISEGLFEKIVFNRKTETYREAIQIARLLLLNYHPDLTKGTENVLAIMFDMNTLWERFVYRVLKRESNFQVRGQQSMLFWKPDKGKSSSLRPDIKIIHNGQVFILDTKWKKIGMSNPAIEDLRQMYSYIEYFEAEKSALVYPAIGDNNVKHRNGHYYRKNTNELLIKHCGLIFINTGTDFQDLKLNVVDSIYQWIG